MLLRLQKLDVTYKRGKEMYIADALSRAYPKGSEPVAQPQSEFYHQVEGMELTEHLPISQERQTTKDLSTQALMKVVQIRWPNHKGLAPPKTLQLQGRIVRPNGQLFKGE